MTGGAYKRPPSSPRSSGRTTVTSGTRPRTSASCDARRRQRQGPPVGKLDRTSSTWRTKTWQECLALGEANGYRNAQASLLAPTGTIGFMMDCDTTGIEPDLALVKFKKLVGGGSMQIVNQTVPRALKNLGYQPEQAEAITEYIAEHGHVVNAPACAGALRGLRLRDGRAVDHPDGPRPDDGRRPAVPFRLDLQDGQHAGGATVEDVEDQLRGLELGLKALAIYRDNCKVGQPLSARRRRRKTG